MAEIDTTAPAAVADALRADNPAQPLAVLQQYADLFCAYQEAQTNIDAFGNVVAHPRTGAPLENPYVKIRDNAAKALRRFGRIKSTDRIWTAAAETRSAAAAPDEPDT